MSDIAQEISEALALKPGPHVERLLLDAADEIERLRLTDAEREAVEWFATFGDAQFAPLSNNFVNHAATLRGLLERFK